MQNFIPEIANEESFFPTQMHKYLQERDIKAEAKNKKVLRTSQKIERKKLLQNPRTSPETKQQVKRSILNIISLNKKLFPPNRKSAITLLRSSDHEQLDEPEARGAQPEAGEMSREIGVAERAAAGQSGESSAKRNREKRR